MGAQAYDEADLEEELENLQQEALDDRLTQTGHVPKNKVDTLPSAPEGGSLLSHRWLRSIGYSLLIILSTVKGKAPAQTEDDEEEELRKLQAEMAM